MILQGLVDGSTTNFDVKLYWDEQQGSVAAARYYTFDGWVAASGAYATAPITTGMNRNGANFGTVNFHAAADWDTINFSSTGLAKLLSASIDSTARFAIVSSRDSSASAPTGSEFVTFTSTNPRLEVVAGWIDSVPSSIVATSIAGATDSILVTWVDNSSTETGYALVDSATGLRMGGNDSTAAGVTVKRYGGLTPNSYHAIKVMVLGGQIDQEISTSSDACYTRAATLPKPTVIMVTDSTRKITIDTTGIFTSFTRIALQDSITGRFVDWISGALDTLAAGTDSSTADYRTYANWNGALGDTVKYEVGKTSAFRTWTRSAQ
jgi:hypothetical protein